MLSRLLKPKNNPTPSTNPQPLNLNYSDFTPKPTATPQTALSPITEVVAPSTPSIAPMPNKVNFFNDPKHENLRRGLKIAAVIAAIVAVFGALLALSLLCPGIGLIPVIGGMGVKAAGIGAGAVAAHTAMAGTTLATAKTGLFALNAGVAINVSNGQAAGMIACVVAILGLAGLASGCGNRSRGPVYD